MELKTIVETLLFVSGRVLGTSEMMEILAEVPEGPKPTRSELEEVLEAIQKDWQGRAEGVQLARVAEGFEFRSAPELGPWVRLLNRAKPARLSTSAVESLAMIAYRQPITRSEIESLRGVDSGAVLKTLLERHLIRSVGRKEEPGRPILYATTQQFLEFFGLNDLADLPPLKELEEMIHQASPAEPATPQDDLALSSLISTPEDLSTLEAGDREALEELDQSLRHLKEVEKTIKEASPTESDSLP